MSRYIDAIPLIEKWKKECGRGTNNGICQGDCFDCQFPAAIDDLKDAPTVDAVPVVRCRECKKWTRYDKETGRCVYEWHLTREDWFCADGERRTDEQQSKG